MRDETCSAQLPSLFCQLRLSGLHLTTRMASGPPPALEGVRRCHEPLGEGPPTLAAGGPGPGPPHDPRTSLVLMPTLCPGGVRDRHVPRYRWSTQDPDLQGPWNATTSHLENCTPYSDDHAACWGWQDAGAIFARSKMMPRTTATPDTIPHSTRLLYPHS